MDIQEKSQSIATNAAELLGPGLGIFSLALGVAEVLGAKPLARAIGVDPDGSGPVVMRVFGFREIAAGIAVLMQSNRPLPLWVRVAGDAMDLGALALAARGKRSSGKRLAFAVAAVLGVTALDVIAGLRAQRLQSEG
jgi:hypothetical protein